MRRRDFLKTAAAAAALGCVAPARALADEKGVRRFDVDYAFDIKSDEEGPYPARLWNPLPLDAPWQRVRLLGFDGDYDTFEINTLNPYDARTFYARWRESDRPKRVSLRMRIETRPRNVPIEAIEEASRRDLPVPDDAAFYLKPTEHIPTDGKIRAKAGELTKGVTDRFEKVRRIYDWVTTVTFRDPKVIGCGVGHAGRMIESGYFGGKCTDISSLFVALLRAAGVPAREVFGIRLGRSHFSKALGKADAKGFADITTWQHCRAEYFIPGLGWVPCDPADITKLELVEKLGHDHPRVKELKARYLHSWEMNWMAFNHARDFVLYPRPEQYPLNMFGYPYAEIGDEPRDYYNPKAFAYRITSREL